MKLNLKPCEVVTVLRALRFLLKNQEGSRQERKETEVLVNKIKRQLTEI